MSCGMSDTDLQLLARYAKHHAEDAIAELVQRHIGLVYSAALRQVRSPQLAEEVAQTVFTSLARDAKRLRSDTILTAWLYQVTHHTAANVVRGEVRRQLRESRWSETWEMHAMNTTDADWSHIEPLLDEAMHALDETDRAAVLLRYFENKSLREVGQALGASENAAQKRLTRAVEHLREFFAKRGVTVGASGLVVVISTNAVQGAPAGMAVTISTATALAGTTLITTATGTATKAIAMTTSQKTLAAVALVAAMGVGINQVREAKIARNLTQTLIEQQASLEEEIQQMTRERDDAVRQVAAQRDDVGAELLRLRNEVGLLKHKLAETPEQKAQSSTAPDQANPPAAPSTVLRAKVARLREVLEQMPHLIIPELQFCTEQNWISAADSSALKTDEDYRWSLSVLRELGEGRFAEMAFSALKKYVQASNGQFPSEVSQLQSFFESPVEEAILQRYEIVSAKTVPGIKASDAELWGDWLIVSKAPVDPRDARLGIGLNRYGHSLRFFSPSRDQKIDRN